MKSVLSGILVLCMLFTAGCQSRERVVSSDTVTTERRSPETDGSAAASGSGYLYQDMEYSYHTDVSQVLEYLVTDMAPEYLLLANKEHPLGEAYRPDRTVTLTCRTYLDKEIALESRTASALYAMLAEMAADGVTDIMVASGYRDYRYQVSLFNQYLNNERASITADAYAYFGQEYIQAAYLSQGKTGLSRQDAELVVRSYAAYPGTSEHQTGMCVDLLTSNTRLNRSFEDTAAFRWLSQNCHRFGFILRYPEGKTEQTGYSYEPWHYRFVGREAATEIMLRGLSLEEFLAAEAAAQQAE